MSDVTEISTSGITHKYHIAKSTITGWVKAGKLKRYGNGGNGDPYYFKVSDVEKTINESYHCSGVGRSKKKMISKIDQLTNEIIELRKENSKLKNKIKN